MKKITLNGKEYQIITDYRDAIDMETIEPLLTDYFDDFDYIVGDWAYGKLRLKGFYKEDNTKATKANNIKYVQEYIDTKCAYGCKWFQIMKND